MEYGEVLDEMHQQLSDIGDIEPDDNLILVKPDEATDEQWDLAAKECGMV